MIKTCVQFDSLDKCDKMKNCGMCRHYIDGKCEVVELIKRECEKDLLKYNMQQAFID